MQPVLATLLLEFQLELQLQRILPAMSVAQLAAMAVATVCVWLWQ